MNPAASPPSAQIPTRVICALLAIGAFAALIHEIVTSLHTGLTPTVGQLLGDAVVLWGIYLFGYYAIKGPGKTDRRLSADPSERVMHLAIQPGSKIEAIKAYREETGADVKAAREVVERLASPD